MPACLGRRITASYGEAGIIQEDQGHYIGVVLDNDPKKRVLSYHPMDGVKYGDMAKALPLKQWEVLTKGGANWIEVDLYIGDAHHYVQVVSAATRSQAKYKAYQEMADIFDDEPKAMLEFKARRACPSCAARQCIPLFNDNASPARAGHGQSHEQ